jgi:hypothetical protein
MSDDLTIGKLMRRAVAPVERNEPPQDNIVRLWDEPPPRDFRDRPSPRAKARERKLDTYPASLTVDDIKALIEDALAVERAQMQKVVIAVREATDRVNDELKATSEKISGDGRNTREELRD